RLNSAIVGQRIRQIGSAEFEEIRTVLKQEDLLLPPKSDLSTYVEFAAVYLELRYFAPGLLGWYFPGIQHPHNVDAILREDIDVELLFSSTRLPGAADPSSIVGAPGSELPTPEPELAPLEN